VRTPSTLLAAFVLLVVAGCGVTGQASGGSTTAGGQPLEQAAAPAAQTVDFGGQYRFHDGLTVVVSTPKSFRPSGSAYPHSERAVAFEISLRNDGSQPYRLSGLSVSATVAGTAAKQLVDSTLGYTGIIDADKDVPPGRDAQFMLAFAVPEQSTPLRLSVRPAKVSPVSAIYSGSA
jgi:hypothetical protein